MFVVAYLFVPELKNRSLEEVDQLFASNTPIRKFGKVKTQMVERMETADVHEIEYSTKNEDA